MDFEVQMVPANSQVNRENHFFDLGLDEGQKETIQVKLRNFGNKTIKVQSSLNNAITQIGGGIIYRPTEVGIIRETQQTLMDVAAIKKADQTITIEPNAEKIVSATVKMPEGQTNGMIYGAWHFIEYGKKDSGKNSSISGNYAYNIGVMLRGQNYKVYPELKYQTVEPIVKNGHPALGIQLNNVKAMAIKNAQVKAVIYRQGLFKSKRVYQTTNVDVAPNSEFTVPISWGYDQMKPGKYTVDVAVNGKSYWNLLPMTWHFKKTITVNSQQANKINKESIQKPANKWAYVATASGVLMLVSFGLIFRALRLTRGQ
ncbi:DUF916 and DUF3324 domain-containing protein [Latilactobacillus fuchuensis]|nr:DUF916 and DUF3324 domain-containing protein [Latilactobacillus fuchuensis]